MDAAAALADLTEISSQVGAAVVIDREGAVLASTPAGEVSTEKLVRAGIELIEAAESSLGKGVRRVTQLEVALRGGSVFVTREDGLAIVARTSAKPSSGLVFYDLRTCLRSVAEDVKQPARRPARRENQEATSPDA